MSYSYVAADQDVDRWLAQGPTPNRAMLTVAESSSTMGSALAMGDERRTPSDEDVVVPCTMSVRGTGYAVGIHRMVDASDYKVKGENRDRRRGDERMKQVVHPPVLYHGHRAGRKADERRLAQTIKRVRKKGS